MPDFNVCLPKHPGYIHYLGLFEFCELLTFSLQDLGFGATFRINDVDLSCRNIIVGCHALDQRDMPDVPAATIMVNTEQIDDENPLGWNENILTWAGNFETWDYSPSNIAYFAQCGVPGVKLLEIGHQPQLSRITKAAEQDIDVLFYGSLTERRKAVLSDLRDRGLKVLGLFGVYGEQRDHYIGRSKVVLNLHNHATEIFEIVRVHYLLSNAVAVVSEQNPTTKAPGRYQDAVAGVHYEGIVDECVRLVHDREARTGLEQRGLQVISRYPQSEFTRKLL